MNSLLSIILISGVFIGSGWYLTYLIPKIQKIERISLAFLLGAGTTTYLWFLITRLGLPIDFSSFILSSFLVAGFGYTLTRFFHLTLSPSSHKPLSKTEQYLGYAVIFLLISAFVIGSYNPLTAWDAIALYDFRGHAIALSHSLADFTHDSYYISYPLMTSLVHSLFYMLGSDSAQGIHAIIFASFIGIIYGRLSDWLNPKYALFACLLIVLQIEIFSHATFAYTNLPYTSYLVAGFLYAVTVGRYSLILSALLLGLSTWVRSAEVFWIAGILLLLYQGFKSRRLIQSVLGTIMILLTRYGWNTYTAQVMSKLDLPSESLTTHLSISILPQIVHNLPAIISYVKEYLINPYLVIWLLVLPCIYLSLRYQKQRLFTLLAPLVISVSLVVVGVMIFSTYFATWNQIGDSAKRMILFIIPYVIIIAVYGLAQLDPKVKHEK